MKKQKVLALALAAAVLTGSAGAVFTDQEALTFPQAAEAVVELGIMEAGADGGFDPAGTVTREEMARIVCLILNGGKDPNLTPLGASAFSDTQGRPLAGYVDYCANLGVVVGKGDGTFGPEEPLTGTAAAKMLLVCMGYIPEHEKYQEDQKWDVNIGVQASQIDLFEGVDQGFGEPVTREELAQILLNALTTPMIEYEYKPRYTGDGAWDPVPVATQREDGKTLLHIKFGMELVDGALKSAAN